MSSRIARLAVVLAAAAGSTLVPGGAHAAYPPAGDDSFDSSAQVFLTPVPGCAVDPLVIDEVLSGPTRVHRGTPYAGTGGAMTIDTEIVSMSLTGQTVTIRQDPDRRSFGKVMQQVPGEDFPADSFFDVFVEVELSLLPGLVFENLMPVHMESEIWSLPPHVFPYLPPPGTCVPLAIEGTPIPVLWLIHAEHTPETKRTCAMLSGQGKIFDPMNPFVTGPVSFPPSPMNVLDLVYGTPSTPTTADMIDFTAEGAWQNPHGPVRVHLDDLVHIGSPGTVHQPGPHLDSFFDVFVAVSLDGVTTGGLSLLRLQGSISPTAGGAGTLFQPGQMPIPGGPLVLEGLMLSLTTVPCTGRPYPPPAP